jgi:ligand-binding sensor domain-containing protein
VDVFAPTADPNLHRVPDLAQDPIDANVLCLPVPVAGLGRFDIGTREFSIHGADPTDPQSLSTTNTERVFVDRSGMLWVGVNGVGVDRFNPGTVGMSHFRYNPSHLGSLLGSHVRGLFQESDGGLWVGTTDRQGLPRLSRFDPRMRIFRHFRHDETDPRSLSDGRIRTVLVDGSGRVWVGVERSGLDMMPPGQMGVFRHFRRRSDDPTSLSHDVVRNMLEDRNGTVWVATNGGLDKVVSPERGTFDHYFHDPLDENTLTGNRTVA